VRRNPRRRCGRKRGRKKIDEREVVTVDIKGENQERQCHKVGFRHRKRTKLYNRGPGRVKYVAKVGGEGKRNKRNIYVKVPIGKSNKSQI